MRTLEDLAVTLKLTIVLNRGAWSGPSLIQAYEGRPKQLLSSSAQALVDLYPLTLDLESQSFDF